MSVILEILLIDVKTGIGKASQKAYTITEAHCVMRNVDGTPAGVGVTILGREIAADAKPGLYTCSFGLRSSTYGDDSGRIVAEIVGLTPISMSQLKPVAKTVSA